MINQGDCLMWTVDGMPLHRVSMTAHQQREGRFLKGACQRMVHRGLTWQEEVRDTLWSVCVCERERESVRERDRVRDRIKYIIITERCVVLL